MTAVQKRSSQFDPIFGIRLCQMIGVLCWIHDLGPGGAAVRNRLRPWRHAARVT